MCRKCVSHQARLAQLPCGPRKPRAASRQTSRGSNKRKKRLSENNETLRRVSPWVARIETTLRDLFKSIPAADILAGNVIIRAPVPPSNAPELNAHHRN